MTRSDLITGFEDGYFYLSWYSTFGYCSFDTKRLPLELHWVQTEYLEGGANDTVAELYRQQIGSEMYYSCVSAQDKYVAALYWAIMTITSIGYGDIRLRSNFARAQNILFIFVGLVLIPMRISELQVLLSLTNPYAKAYTPQNK